MIIYKWVFYKSNLEIFLLLLSQSRKKKKFRKIRDVGNKLHFFRIGNKTSELFFQIRQIQNFFAIFYIFFFIT